MWFPSDFENLPVSEQLAVVQGRVREHYRETGGRYIGFGQILSYRFAYSFDASIVVDVGCNVIENNGGKFSLPEAWLDLA